MVQEASDTEQTARTKRQAGVQKLVVELLIVVDYGVYELWLQRTKAPTEAETKQAAIERITEYYSFVLNGIDLRYASIQSNFSVDISFAVYAVFQDPLETYWSGGKLAVSTPRDLVEASDALEAFRAWALNLGPSLPPSDHVMLFTGFNLSYGGSVSNAGLAYLGSACNSEYHFSIVEEYFEFRTVAVAAHELGHRNDTNCLVTSEAITSNAEIQPFLVFQPGEVYPGDQFCQLNDKCPFGDDPSLLLDGKNCSEHVRTDSLDCYMDKFRARCCESCAEVSTNLPGCEFGDKVDTCERLESPTIVVGPPLPWIPD
nr:hypothetical protein BaRGS_009764 [Batillaria attramentaria]